MSENEELVSLPTGQVIQVGYIKADSMGLPLMEPYPIGVRIGESEWVPLADILTAGEILADRSAEPEFPEL